MSHLFKVCETVMIERSVAADNPQQAREIAMKSRPDYKDWELTGSYGVDVICPPDYDEVDY